MRRKPLELLIPKLATLEARGSKAEKILARTNVARIVEETLEIYTKTQVKIGQIYRAFGHQTKSYEESLEYINAAIHAYDKAIVALKKVNSKLPATLLYEMMSALWQFAVIDSDEQKIHISELESFLNVYKDDINKTFETNDEFRLLNLCRDKIEDYRHDMAQSSNSDEADAENAMDVDEPAGSSAANLEELPDAPIIIDFQDAAPIASGSYESQAPLFSQPMKAAESVAARKEYPLRSKTPKK